MVITTYGDNTNNVQDPCPRSFLYLAMSHTQGRQIQACFFSVTCATKSKPAVSECTEITTERRSSVERGRGSSSETGGLQSMHPAKRRSRVTTCSVRMEGGKEGDKNGAGRRDGQAINHRPAIHTPARGMSPPPHNSSNSRGFPLVGTKLPKARRSRRV